MLSAFTESNLGSGIGGLSRDSHVDAPTSGDSSRSDSDVSTSSSYSSLSDFVTEMVNSEISGEISAHQTDSCAHVLVDQKSVFCPPVTFQLKATPLPKTIENSSDDQKSSRRGSDASSSASSSASPSADEGEGEKLFNEEGEPDKAISSNRSISPEKVVTPETEPVVPVNRSPLPLSRCSTPQKTRSLEQENRPLSAEPSVDKDKGSASGTSSPTLSRTISISSVFSRTGSLAGVNNPGSHSGSPSSGSFLERFTR